MVEFDDLALTLLQPGKGVIEDFQLFVPVAEVKGIGIITGQERWLDGRLCVGRRRGEGARITIKPRTLNLVQPAVPLRQIHSLCRGHLLVRDRATELDLQFVIELLDFFALAPYITGGWIGSSEAI